MQQTTNCGLFRGYLSGAPEFSHENHARRFYRFFLEIPRLSGAVDTLPVIVPQEILEASDATSAETVEVSGQVRSLNAKAADGSRKLLISVFAETLCGSDKEPVNAVQLQGIICKAPVYRRTPLGREICDVMLAVNRHYRRTDYLPCIFWGNTAQLLSQASVGCGVSLSGRLQSRQYLKVLDGKSEYRTAYEISAMTASTDLQTEPVCL